MFPPFRSSHYVLAPHFALLVKCLKKGRQPNEDFSEKRNLVAFQKSLLP